MDMSELERLEQQQRITRLSEAIRIGARIRPQCYVALFHEGASCALGAAYEGATGKTFNGPQYSLLNEVFPQLNCSPRWEGSLGHRIAMWNDAENLTREQIADKLEAMGY